MHSFSSSFHHDVFRVQVYHMHLFHVSFLQRGDLFSFLTWRMLKVDRSKPVLQKAVKKALVSLNVLGGSVMKYLVKRV